MELRGGALRTSRQREQPQVPGDGDVRGAFQDRQRAQRARGRARGWEQWEMRPRRTCEHQGGLDEAARGLRKNTPSRVLEQRRDVICLRLSKDQQLLRRGCTRPRVRGGFCSDKWGTMVPLPSVVAEGTQWGRRAAHRACSEIGRGVSGKESRQGGV